MIAKQRSTREQRNHPWHLTCASVMRAPRVSASPPASAAMARSVMLLLNSPNSRCKPSSSSFEAKGNAFPRSRKMIVVSFLPPKSTINWGERGTESAAVGVAHRLMTYDVNGPTDVNGFGVQQIPVKRHEDRATAEGAALVLKPSHAHTHEPSSRTHHQCRILHTIRPQRLGVQISP
jgi:hypothetical protein